MADGQCINIPARTVYSNCGKFLSIDQQIDKTHMCVFETVFIDDKDGKWRSGNIRILEDARVNEKRHKKFNTFDQEMLLQVEKFTGEIIATINGRLLRQSHYELLPKALRNIDKYTSLVADHIRRSLLKKRSKGFILERMPPLNELLEGVLHKKKL